MPSSLAAWAQTGPTHAAVSPELNARRRSASACCSAAIMNRLRTAGALVKVMASIRPLRAPSTMASAGLMSAG